MARAATGSVRARKGGSWQVRVAGKTATAFSRREAERMRRSMLEAHERATNMGRVEMTVGDFKSVWLDDCAGRLTPKTIHFYGWVCDLPMMKPMRALNLNDVTPRQIAKTVAQVSDQHGRRTGLAAFRTLSAMFGLAERWGYLDTNPCRRMQAPTVPKREPTVPPPAVMERAIRTATPEFGALLRFAISSGCRRGEIAGVRWSDFNDELGIVTVRRSIDSTPGNGLAKETKTSRAKVISLDPATLEALEAHKARQTDQGRNNGWVWSRDHDGDTPLRPDLITSRWTSLRKRIPELEGVRFHDIRHATATWLIAAGMDPRTVADRLGHENVQLTLSTYTAPVAASDRRAATIISDLLAAANGAAALADLSDGERPRP